MLCDSAKTVALGHQRPFPQTIQLGFHQAEGHSITVAMIPVLFSHRISPSKHLKLLSNPAHADRNLQFYSLHIKLKSKGGNEVWTQAAY